MVKFVSPTLAKLLGARPHVLIVGDELLPSLSFLEKSSTNERQNKTLFN